MDVFRTIAKTVVFNPARVLWTHELRLVIAAEILFVAGWSLMWASSLDLFPFPVRACPLLMIVGLGLGACAKRSARPSKHQTSLAEAPGLLVKIRE